MSTELSQVLASPYIWRGRNAIAVPQTIACGHAPLAALLCGGGWRLGANTELLLPHAGIGELQLLAPALQQLHLPEDLQRKQWIAFVEPPFLPHLPTWQALGFTPSRLLWVRIAALPKRLWAIEQLLRSDHCGAVVSWLPEPKVKDRDMRRLQQAAAHGNGLHMVFRPHRVAADTSASACRLLLKPDRRALSIEVIKQRGQWGGQHCSLQFDTHHQLMPQLPIWQWPVARANQQSGPIHTDVQLPPEGTPAPPLIDGVMRGEHG
jgi:protein ImuA